MRPAITITPIVLTGAITLVLPLTTSTTDTATAGALPDSSTADAPAATPTPAPLVSTPAVRRPSRPVRVPGSLEGLGFDTCTAPKQRTMDTLRARSPYWGVGVYIGGEARGCSQPELTRRWVAAQHRKGWRIFPLWVGLQAPILRRGTPGQFNCTSRTQHPMSPHADRARAQGVSAANRAIRNARGLGMKRGSTLFLDMEAYDNRVGRCTRPVLTFQSGWSHRLQARGWRSGFYSSGASGIADLDRARARTPHRYTWPNVLWLGWGNGRANLEGEPYVRDSFWRRQRLHQYELDRWKRFGSVRIHLDQNAIRVGRGSTPGRSLHTCGVNVTYPRYWRWRFGDRSTQIPAGQCLLRRHGLYAGRFSKRFDITTARAVGEYQRRRDLQVTRTLNAPTWTSLLASGTRPLVKRGSSGDRVRWLQRTLTAALGQRVEVDGTFGPSTTRAVRHYQRGTRLAANGIVGKSTWNSLQRGRR
jgi:peptidoglycan hydrolase-like protein with peptidoglycan-binding domain